MKATECKVAFVGAGNMAREHIRAFADIEHVTLSGIFSRTRTRAETLAKEFRIRGVYNSLDALYEGTHADLVVITVFETAMLSVSCAAFDYPWTVLMEKPPGYNRIQTQEILQCAHKKDRRVFVALNRRLLSSSQVAIKDLVANPLPRFIHVQDQQSLKQAKAIGQPDIIVQNWMYANSIHLVDYLRFFGRGSIASIQPILSWDPKNPSIVLAKISFSSGDIGIYEGIWSGPGPWAVSVTTSSRRWEMRPLEHAMYQNYGARNLIRVETHPWDVQFKPGFRCQAQEAVKGAMGEPSQCVMIDEAYETMCLIEGIFS
jgi:predicted dehydrogenase